MCVQLPCMCGIGVSTNVGIQSGLCNKKVLGCVIFCVKVLSHSYVTQSAVCCHEEGLLTEQENNYHIRYIVLNVFLKKETYAADHYGDLQLVLGSCSVEFVLAD